MSADTFDPSAYTIAPGEKAVAFLLRVLRSEGACDADSAIPKDRLAPLCKPITFLHLMKSPFARETPVGGAPAFYALPADAAVDADETSATSEPAAVETPEPAAAPTEEKTMDTTPAETAAETPAAETTTAAPVAAVVITREPFEIVKPTTALTDAEPGVTLQSVVLRVIYEAPRPVCVREVTELTGVARQSVAQAVTGAFKAGLLTRTEGEDPFHYGLSEDKIGEAIEIINARAHSHAVWAHIKAAPADAETVSAATGISDSAARSALRSLVEGGWAALDHKVGRNKFYGGFAERRLGAAEPEEADAGDVVDAAPEIVETAPVIVEPAPVAAAPVAAVVEAAPAPAPAAAPLSIFEQLLQSDDGVAALRASFDANALLIAAITKVAKKS